MPPHGFFHLIYDFLESLSFLGFNSEVDNLKREKEWLADDMLIVFFS